MSELLPPQSPVFTAFAIADINGFTQKWDSIRHLGRRCHYLAGAMLDREGESQFDLLCIENGSMSVVYDTYDGKTRTVITFEKGSIANIASAITRTRASGHFQCTTDCTIWQFPSKLLHDPSFVAGYPEFIIYVMKIIGTVVLTHHTSLTDMRLDDFTIRFCRFLLSLSIKHKSLDFVPNMTQEHVTTMLGIHKATLARSIKQLKKDNIIETFTTRRAVILDIERLRELATH